MTSLTASWNWRRLSRSLNTGTTMAMVMRIGTSARHDPDDRIDDAMLVGVGQRAEDREENRARGDLLRDGQRQRAVPVAVQRLEMHGRNAPPARHAQLHEPTQHVVAVRTARRQQADRVRLIRVIRVRRPGRYLEL